MRRVHIKTVPGHEACSAVQLLVQLLVQLVCSWCSLEENRFPLYQRVPMPRACWSGREPVFTSPLSEWWNFTNLNLCRSCAFCHNLCEFICPLVLLYVWLLFPCRWPSALAHSVFLPLLCRSLSLEWRGLMKVSPSHLGLSKQHSCLMPEHCAPNIMLFLDTSKVPSFIGETLRPKRIQVWNLLSH